MSINFATLQGLTIPEGVVTQIEKDGVVLWVLNSSGGDTVVLEVEKIVSDTYASEITYTAEEFILLDIYPETNGTVSVTYGGLTKTITDTSGAEEPNAQQVFFGTFNGVSDSVATPSSGTLTIEGDYYAFGIGRYSATSKTYGYSSCVTEIKSNGKIKVIPNYFCYLCKKIKSFSIPSDVEYIGGSAFHTTGLTNIRIPRKVTFIGDNAFAETDISSVLLPSSVESIRAFAFSGCPLKTVQVESITPPVLLDSDLDGTGSYLQFGYEGQDTVSTKKHPFQLEQIIVPKGCGDTYKTATGWSLYSDYIVEES